MWTLLVMFILHKISYNGWSKTRDTVWTISITILLTSPNIQLSDHVVIEFHCVWARFISYMHRFYAIDIRLTDLSATAILTFFSMYRTNKQLLHFVIFDSIVHYLISFIEQSSVFEICITCLIKNNQACIHYKHLIHVALFYIYILHYRGKILILF